MADQKEVSLIVKLKDGITQNFQKMSNAVKKNFDSMKQAALVFTGAFAAIGATIYKSIQAFGVQEDAIATLNQALKNTGNYSDAASRDLQAYASELQKQTVYGDEAILKSQSLIASFGFEGETLKKLTKATLDLAAAKGMDLKSAADLVSKSVGSTTNALTRYGIQVEGAAGSTERAQNAIENITALFGGQAQAQAQTFAGSVQQMKNAIGDAAEKIGKAFAPVLTDLAKIIKNAAEKFQEIYPSIKDLIVPITVLTAGITGLMAAGGAIVTLGPLIAAAFAAITGPVGIAVVAISSITAALLYFKNSNSEVAIKVRAIWQTLGDIISKYAEAISLTLKFKFGEAKQAYKDLVDLVKNSSDVFKQNVEAEKAAIQESLDAKAEAIQAEGELRDEKKETDLERDQEYLDRKAEMEQIAEDVRLEMEEQKKIYDQMTAEQKIKLLTDTLGKEQILRTNAQINELIKDGKHKEAKLLQDKMYSEAFTKNTKDMLADADAEWRKHWDAQVAQAIIGRELTTEEYDAMQNFYSNVMQLMGKESIAAFRVMQGVAIVNTLVATYESATKAFNSLVGIPVVGTILGYAAAAAAVAAGLQNADNIRRQRPPQAETGAYVQKGGYAELHDQEMVLNKQQTEALTAGTGLQDVYLIMDGDVVGKFVVKLDEAGRRMGRVGTR